MQGAADQSLHTKTTPAWSTGTGAEAALDGSEAVLRGFRAKWRKLDGSLVSDIGLMAGNSVLSGSSVGVGAEKNEMDADLGRDHTLDGLPPVVDLSKDELLTEQQLGAYDKEQLSRHHERQAISNTDLGIFKFPWEKGRLAKIFTDVPVVNLKVPKLQPSSRNLLQMHIQVNDHGSMSAKPVLKSSAVDGHKPVFLDIVKSLADVAQPVDRDARRAKALNAWWLLLSHNLTASAIGLKVTVEATPDNVLETALAILDATFAVKSPGTLLRRVYAVQSYEDWCVETLSKHWLPVQEFDVWRYVRWLQSSKAPPTKASSLVEALRFAWYLLGCEGCDTAEQSLRVKGVSSQMRASKQPWRPAALLSVDEVKELHRLLDDTAAPLGDRCIAGHLLHMLYSRSRWSDLLSITSIYMDPESQFLEVATRCHKAARGAEQKSKLLPIVCPCTGIVGSNWVTTYFEVRQMCGLTLPEAGPGPMMCCPTNEAATAWTKRAMTSEEGSDFMRRVLKAPKTEERRISSHSLKSTVMSWAAKYGLSEHSRAILARHASKAATATAVYSRDLLSPVLRELNLVINAVRTGAFCPDATRSGMLTPGALPYMGGTPLPMPGSGAPMTPVPDVSQLHRDSSEPVELDEEQDGDQSSLHGWQLGPQYEADACDSASVSNAGAPEDQDAVSETTEENSVQSSSDSNDEGPVEQHRGLVDFPSDLVINNKSLVVHYVKMPNLLGCGRKLTPSYSKIAEMTGIRCSRCFDV